MTDFLAASDDSARIAADEGVSSAGPAVRQLYERAKIAQHRRLIGLEQPRVRFRARVVSFVHLGSDYPVAHPSRTFYVAEGVDYIHEALQAQCLECRQYR